MKFTKIPTDTFKNLQLNAGVLVSTFEPATAAITAEDIIGATSGGNTFNATPTYSDWGSDIDNCPKNTKELKKLESWEAKMTGNFAAVSEELAKRLTGAADLAESTGKITPRGCLKAEDFQDLWWVGDYSDVNEDSSGSAQKAGFIAIHMMNTLSTGGFQIKSADKGKGQFSFEFTAHYDMDNIDTVPFEIYVKEGTKAS